MTWRDEVRRCVCGDKFVPQRAAQAYCSKRCAKAATSDAREVVTSSTSEARYAEVVTGPPGIILEALKGIHENKPSVTPQWCGPLRTNTAVRWRVPSTVMTTPSNITRTVIETASLSRPADYCPGEAA